MTTTTMTTAACPSSPSEVRTAVDYVLALYQAARDAEEACSKLAVWDGDKTHLSDMSVYIGAATGCAAKALIEAMALVSDGGRK
jgi:hypothetical protein